mmetsp:Transcript_71165/g.224812  ORF Transcript_71165/g.224812 Transcript_71165/m.224812 type:complete len:129 (-) Transcript_71165:971-1357(-)
MRTQRAMGEPGPVGVGQAKRWLRDCGGSRGGAIASILCNLSKARNARVHALSARLLEDTGEFCRDTGPTFVGSGSVEVFGISTNVGDDFSGVERVDASTQTGFSFSDTIAAAVVHALGPARARRRAAR